MRLPQTRNGFVSLHDESGTAILRFSGIR